MLGFVLAVPADVKADCEGNRHCIGVFKSYRTLEADYVVGQGDVVVRTLHGFFHHAEGLLVAAAEANLGRIHEH